MPKSVIAGMYGHCLGGGLQIAIGLVNKVVSHNQLKQELHDWVNRYKGVPTATLKWVKHLTNQALDLPFEGFLKEMDTAMQAVLVFNEHLAARQAWRERKRRRRQDEEK